MPNESLQLNPGVRLLQEMVSRKDLSAEVLAAYDARIQQGVHASLHPFRSALIPLFSHKRKRPEIVGTAIGVAAGDARLLFTAAHVMRDFAQDTIFVSEDNGWRSLTGVAHKAETPGWKDPEDDRIDAAVFELDIESRSHWTGWITPQMLRPGASAASGDRFVLAGFPRAKLKYDFDRGKLGPRAMPVFSSPIPSHEYTALRAQPETHIVMGFNRERAVQGGARVTAPVFRGMSGGMMLWAPGVIRPSDVSDTGLAAIFIEWPSPKRVLIGTRVDVHLKLLHARLPHLSHLFPSPNTVR
jgi:hypothetical protein